MRNILHIIDTTGPGGAETVFIELVKSTCRMECNSLPVIRGKGWIYEKLRKSGVEPILLDTRHSFDGGYLYRLVRIIKKHGINLIQSHLLTSNVYSCLAGMVCGIPVIATFHGSVDIGDRRRLLQLKSRILNRGSRRIVFVSNYLRDFFLSTTKIDAKKAVTIYNGIDTTFFYPKRDASFRKELGVTADEVLVGAIGNIRKAKSYDVLLKAAELLARESNKYKFVVVGHGKGELYGEILRLRDRLNLQGSVFFVPFCDDIRRVLNSLDLYVLTSSSEGFSLSTIEAMACGVPVIATKSGGPEEIITDNVNGVLVEPGSPVDTATQIRLLAQDRDLQSRLVRVARESVSSRFTLHSMIERYEGLYAEC